MNVRGWAVGVISAAAMMAGVVAVQSGVAGTAALPILPHRSMEQATQPELPAPAEVRSQISAPPSARTMQQTPVAPAAVVPDQPSTDPRPTADRPEKRPSHKQPGDQRHNGDGHDGSGNGPGSASGRDSGSNSGPGSGDGSGHGSGHDSHGGPGQH